MSKTAKVMFGIFGVLLVVALVYSSKLGKYSDDLERRTSPESYKDRNYGTEEDERTDEAQNRVARNHGLDALSPVADARLSNRQPEPETVHSQPQTAPSRSPLESVVDRPAPRFSELDYQIYREFMNAPMSESEDDARKRLARKYGKSASEIELLVDRMLKAEFAVNTDDVKKKIQAAITADVNIKSIIVSGSFANVSFIETSAALNDDDVRRKVLDRMPEVLGQVFEVDTIQRVRLTAYYPSTSGDTMKVASFEALRSDYRLGKRPNRYSEFWVR